MSFSLCLLSRQGVLIPEGLLSHKTGGAGRRVVWAVGWGQGGVRTRGSRAHAGRGRPKEPRGGREDHVLPIDSTPGPGFQPLDSRTSHGLPFESDGTARSGSDLLTAPTELMRGGGGVPGPQPQHGPGQGTVGCHIRNLSRTRRSRPSPSEALPVLRCHWPCQSQRKTSRSYTSRNR